jgi:hypothetical protein
LFDRSFAHLAAAVTSHAVGAAMKALKAAAAAYEILLICERGPCDRRDVGIRVRVPADPVGFANSGGLVFMDESAE